MYKVVVPHKGKYYSFNKLIDDELTHQKKLVVEYEVGEWTYPIIPHSKLFVFESLRMSKLFARGLSCEIFKCEVGHAEPCNFVCYLTGPLEEWWREYTTGNIWWREYTTGGILFRNDVKWAPIGTFMTDRVKLVRKVYDFKTLWREI